MKCICPPMRNHIACPNHVLVNRLALPHLTAAPIFAHLAWEMDLNWSTDKMDWLFWQHDRIKGWEFADA